MVLLQPDKPLVLWDGECGFCGSCVAWALSRDPESRLDFEPYQEVSELSLELHEACAKAVHVVKPDGAVLRAGRAVLFVFGQIGWPRLSAALSLPPMIWCVELGYKLVARHRGRLSRLT
jgi:predicted DCC family thiol-disulfide oxidoreductase YuxK